MQNEGISFGNDLNRSVNGFKILNFAFVYRCVAPVNANSPKNLSHPLRGRPPKRGGSGCPTTVNISYPASPTPSLTHPATSFSNFSTGLVTITTCFEHLFRVFHRTYPHFPQVSPQAGWGKALKRRGFFTAPQKIPQPFVWLWNLFGFTENQISSKRILAEKIRSSLSPSRRWASTWSWRSWGKPHCSSSSWPSLPSEK